MKALLIEDEEHKANDLKSRLLSCGITDNELSIVNGVRDAVISVTTTAFDLIILDMALPTFGSGVKDGSGGGIAQAVGGIEILRMLKTLKRRSNIIIVTQYPDVIIEGRKIKLNQVGKMITQRYEQNVLGAILYSYNTPAWEKQFDILIRRVK